MSEIQTGKGQGHEVAVPAVPPEKDSADVLQSGSATDIVLGHRVGNEAKVCRATRSNRTLRWVGQSNLRTTGRYTHFGTDFRQHEAARVAVLNGVDLRSNNSKLGPIGPKKTKLQRKGEAA